MRRTHNVRHAHSKFAALLFLLFTAGAGPAAAQSESASPTPTPKSAEVLRLEEEKAQAVLRKEIAEANKAELAAKFPAPTSSPLAGTTTINDGAIIESQIVAYSALARAANRIVDAINISPGVEKAQVDRLAIFNENDVALLLSHKTTKSQIEVLRQSYCLLLAPSVTGEDCKDAQGTNLTGVVEGVTMAKSLLGSFIDLTSFLRTNVEIKGQTFDIDEAPLAAEVMRAGRRPDAAGFPSGVMLYYPKLFPPDIKPEQKYVILDLLDRVFRLRNTSGGLVAELEKNKEDLTKAKTKVENLTATVEQQGAALDAAREKLSNVLIKAHCPGVPECDRDDPTVVDSRLRKFCPKLTGEQRERILEQASLVKQLDAAVTQAKQSLAKAQDAVGKFEGERTRLFDALNHGALNLPAPKTKAANDLAIDDAVAQMKARNDQVDKFIAGLVQAGSGGGSNALTSLIKAENILTALEPTRSGTYWLQLKVVKAGGNNRIKTNLLWDIFTGGNRVSHSGGVIVEYILFDGGGAVITSDTVGEYTDYIKAGKVRKLPSPAEDNMPAEKKTKAASKDKKKAEAAVGGGN